MSESNNRLDVIQSAIQMAVSTNGAKSLGEVNPTTNELLKFAFRENKLEGDVGICGTVCEGECKVCVKAKDDLNEHFRQDEKWEEQTRKEKECDEIYYCTACQSELSQYEDSTGVHYFCDPCFCGDWEDEDEGYEDTGLDWNESGYFD